jgi:hypothetical protein
MRDAATLGDFLHTRRGRLTPKDVGITSYGARRVQGYAAKNSPSSPT